MSSSQELYNQLSEKLRVLVSVKNSKQVSNWLWIVVGILHSESCHLSQIANYLPMKSKAMSRVTLLRRWLMNPHVKVWSFYKKVLEHIFLDWANVSVIIILDGVMLFGDRWQVVRVSLLHGCRAIPLAWLVVEGKGLVKVTKLKRMLEKVQRFLKRHVKEVLFLADAGFRGWEWAQLCTKLGWNYRIRIARNTYLTLPNGTTARLDRLVPENQNRYFQNALLTKEAQWQAHVAVTWTTDTEGKPELVAIMTNQIACRARLREYAKRMSIEQSFRDDKSGGFDLEHTRLQHADRVNRLLLATAIATLWCHELGEFVLKHGDDSRRVIDPSFQRALSLFQLGFRWLKRTLATAQHCVPAFQARLSNLRLKPVILLRPSNAYV